MVSTLFQRLTEQMEARVNNIYIDHSIIDALGLEPVNLEDISIEKWMHKNLSKLPEAAVHSAGYTPNQAALDAEEFGHNLFTVDEEIPLNEQQWAFAEKHGFLSMGVENLGRMVGKGSSRFVMTGRNGILTAGLGAEISTNNILDEGTGAGTITRPIRNTTATAGAWATWANSQTDIINICAQHEERNYSLSNSVMLYPKCFAKAMKRGGAATREAAPLQMAFEQGIGAAMSIPDQYMVTLANGVPAIGASDLILLDRSTIKIGYTRRQRTRLVNEPSGRGGRVESEVWFVPYCEPQVIDIAGTSTVIKGITAIPAINGA